MRVRSGCRCWCRWYSRRLSDPPSSERGPVGRKAALKAAVFGRYQGAQRWEYEREFADLVTDAAREWRWVPRFEHLLIDQTEKSAESVTGAVAARVLQIAMMATFREAPRELLEWVTRLIGELYRAKGFEEVAKHVEYVLATQPEAQRKLFSEALRKNVPGRGGEVMNYVEEMIERGRREGRQEGRQEGRREGPPPGG